MMGVGRGWQDSMKVGNVIEHSGHLFLEKML